MRWLMSVAALAAVLLLTAPAGLASNAIQRENARPGTTAWLRQLGGDVELYGGAITASPGEQIGFHVSTAYRYL